MRAGDAVREVDVVAVLPVAQPPVVERVEHQLARDTDQVERTGPIVRDERAGRREVLAQHDLVCFDGAVLVGRVLRGELLERGVEVAQLLVGITGLAQLVAALELQRLDPLADVGVGVVAQPVGRLHDVRVGVVDDPAFDVRHA